LKKELGLQIERLVEGGEVKKGQPNALAQMNLSIYGPSIDNQIDANNKS